MAEELIRWCFPMLMTKHAWLSSYLIPFCLKNFFTSSNDTDPKLRESKEWKWRLGCAHRLWSLEQFNTVAWLLKNSLKCPSKMNDRKYLVKRKKSYIFDFLQLKKVCVSDPNLQCTSTEFGRFVSNVSLSRVRLRREVCQGSRHPRATSVKNENNVLLASNLCEFHT